MIQFQNVTKVYYTAKKPIKALDHLSFEIEKGEFVSIVGRSGAGKTTLIKILIGEEKATRGRVLFLGREVGDMDTRELQELRRRIGVVHQDYKLLQGKNVWENVEYVMQVIGARDKDIRRDVPQILDLVGLIDRVESFPEELSGGEKQRLAFARALCHRPEVIVADEPTGNLDLYNTFEVINLLKKIHNLGTTVILSTHNKEVIDSLKKRTITLEQGALLKDQKKGRFIL